MIDWSRVLGFDWDAGNDRKSADKHAVSRTEAEQVFLDPRLLVLSDEKHSLGEIRFHAFGATTNGRQLLISFTLRQNASLIRVISSRDMSRRERARYEEET
jgi:uncharacterized DUF497 family protein